MKTSFARAIIDFPSSVPHRGRLLLLLMSLMFAACASRGTATRDSDRSRILSAGDFESPGTWFRSAPPDYSSYAVIEFDDEIKRRGRHSGHITIYRHPGGSAGADIFHSWAQELGTFPAGARLKIGGWVRCDGQTAPRLTLRCEFEKALNGHTFMNINLPVPPCDDSFQYVEQVIQLPRIATELTLHAGLSSIGEVWFDDLSIIRLPSR